MVILVSIGNIKLKEELFCNNRINHDGYYVLLLIFVTERNCFINFYKLVESFLICCTPYGKNYEMKQRMQRNCCVEVEEKCNKRKLYLYKINKVELS